MIPLKAQLENELYYKAGDTETMTNFAAGYLTSGNTALGFMFVLPKRIKNVTPKLVSGTLTVRTATGGYMENGTSITDTKFKSIDIWRNNSQNCLLISFNYKSAVNVTNNTVLSVCATDFKFQFS